MQVNARKKLKNRSPAYQKVRWWPFHRTWCVSSGSSPSCAFWVWACASPAAGSKCSAPAPGDRSPEMPTPAHASSKAAPGSSVARLPWSVPLPYSEAPERAVNFIVELMLLLKLHAKVPSQPLPPPKSPLKWSHLSRANSVTHIINTKTKIIQMIFNFPNQIQKEKINLKNARLVSKRTDFGLFFSSLCLSVCI